MKTLEATNDNLIREFLNDDNFKLTEFGEVFTCISKQGHKTNTFRLKPIKIDNRGYYTFIYKRKNISVHRAVYQKFNGELNCNLVINHIDGIKTNNYYKNLELVTQSENIKHSYANGKAICYGARKFNEFEILKIRGLRESGLTYSEIMKHFKISKSTLSYILNKKTYVSVA